MDENAVRTYLLTHPDFARSWFKENIGKETLEEWIDMDTVVPLPNVGTTSSLELKVSNSAEAFASDAFKSLMAEGRRRRESVRIDHTKRSKQKLALSEKELLLELIRDVATELDVNVLCYKILSNVSLLTKSDRGSLFLASGTKEKGFLVSKLFDVSAQSTIEESLTTGDKEIIIPFGRGIAGSVAERKKPINIKDCYKVRNLLIVTFNEHSY